MSISIYTAMSSSTTKHTTVFDRLGALRATLPQVEDLKKYTNTMQHLDERTEDENPNVSTPVNTYVYGFEKYSYYFDK